MKILPVEAGGMNISPDFDAEAQLTACRSTHKHAMRLFPPVWTQNNMNYSKQNTTDSANVNAMQCNSRFARVANFTLVTIAANFFHS